MPPVAIVGGGLAGLCTALACAPRPVRIIAPSIAGHGSSSVLAQGGIAAALAPGDSPDAHAHDTFVAGSRRNDARAVHTLTAQARHAVVWLESLGVRFDRDGNGLSLGREGGHRVSRIAHAGGDRSGAAIMAALVEQARRAPHIEWVEGEADGLLLRDGRIAGVRCSAPERRETIIDGHAVVLATGGLGSLFARTTNPAASRGSGIALAMAAGARLRDMEFVQFHPTALATEGPNLPLVTEALRGAGARLRDANGRLLMAGVHPLGDLAPRDVVARRVWQATREGGAWLDATALPRGWEHEFPTVVALCRAHGIDPRSAPVPVTAAAHFHMGGVATDLHGATSLPGLYAVGEVACNGVHGANRLASNSLLECVVFGRRLGEMLREPAPAPRSINATTTIAERGDGLSAGRLARLRELLSNAAGPIRSKASLVAAVRDIDGRVATGWEARVGMALLHGAYANPCSQGAHWLGEPERRVG